MTLNLKKLRITTLSEAELIMTTFDITTHRITTLGIMTLSIAIFGTTRPRLMILDKKHST